jgi:hypothetical protein
MKRYFIAALVLLFWANTTALYLPLSVKETGLAGRTGVPTQTGVPMPRGKYTRADLGVFTVIDSVTHAVVPAAFSVNATWNDSSIRFLNVQFPATVGSGQTANYILADNSANTAGPGEMTVTGTSGTITVVTGPLKFTVKGAPFNVIDEAFVDLSGAKNFDTAHRIIAPGNGGRLMVGSTASGNATVSLYLRTEQRAVIKVQGTMGSHNYLMYITAFRNKPYVQIIHNWYFNNGSAGATFSLSDLSIRLMTELTGARTATVSHAPAETTFTLTSGEGTEISYISNDAYGIRKGTSAIASGRGMTAAGVFEEKRMGWLHVASGDKGIGTGIRHMWQMAPKIIEAKSTGEVIIGLYRYASPAMTYYGGNGRTHSVFVSFGNSAAMAKEAFYTVSQPLYAVAPPVWYCGMTKCLGRNIVHNDPSLFATTSAGRAQFSQYFVKYRNVYMMFGHAFRKAPLLALSISDLYSFIRFGNCTDQQQSCGGQHYSNNYYDFPHLSILGLAVTGTVENLELAWIHDMHMMDLNLDNVSGDCKGCPGVDIWDGYQSCSPRWWGNANHWKSQSFYELWWLTGEPILLDFGNRANLKPMNSSFMGGEHRSTGHILEGLSAAYEATWDVSYRDRMRSYYRSTIDSRTTTPTNNYFQNGIVGEGLMYQLYADTAYTHIAVQLKNWGDFLYANQAEYVWGGYIGQCGWLLNGFTALRDLYPTETNYQVLGDSIWYYFINNAQTTSRRQKFYNEQYRGPIHYMKHLLLDQNYLSNYPDYANMSAAVQARARAASPAVEIFASPNPFRPAVVISWANSGNVKTIHESSLHDAPTLAIYDIHGRIVNRAGNLRTDSYRWNAGDLPSGTYIIKLTAGAKTHTKRLTLLR